jgi:hypothetical protein
VVSPSRSSASRPGDGEAVAVRSSLAAAGPVERIDRAFVLVRRGGLELALPAIFAGAIPAFVVQAFYYLERIEGVGVLRLPAAAALVGAFCVRSWILASVARAHVLALSERAPVSPTAGGVVSVARTAVVIGLGLWVWSWGLALSSLGGPIGIALFLPWLAFRGLFAPSWLARSGCAAESGWSAFGRALADTRHQRGESFLVEGFLLTAVFGLAANLYGVFAAVVLVGRSFLGLEMALVDEFLSFRNTFVLLAVTLVAAVLLEPLRAALSAQVYVDARVRAEGLDLRAALDEAIGRTTRGPARGASRPATRAGGAAAAALLVLAASAGAHAQSPATEPATHAPLESADEDGAARETARRILAEDIFRDVDERRGDGLMQLVERMLAWLFEQEAPDADLGPPPALPSLPLPGPGFFLALGAVFVAAIVAFLVLTRRRELPAAETASTGAAHVPDPRDRSPDDWVGEASTLAAQGRFREALRALYLATLVALDRRAWIRFEPSLTNWQYLRQMPAGDAREDFRDLTRAFDVKVYGAEDASAEDYLRCRTLAERIVQLSRPSLAPEDAPQTSAAERGRSA